MELDAQMQRFEDWDLGVVLCHQQIAETINPFTVYTVHLKRHLAMLWFTKGKHRQFSKWKYLYLIATFQCSLLWKVMLRCAVPGRWLSWRLVILADDFKLWYTELYRAAYLHLTSCALLLLSVCAFGRKTEHRLTTQSLPIKKETWNEAGAHSSHSHGKWTSLFLMGRGCGSGTEHMLWAQKVPGSVTRWDWKKTCVWNLSCLLCHQIKNNHWCKVRAHEDTKQGTWNFGF